MRTLGIATTSSFGLAFTSGMNWGAIPVTMSTSPARRALTRVVDSWMRRRMRVFGRLGYILLPHQWGFASNTIFWPLVHSLRT